MPHFQFGKQTISYQITRSNKRKTLSILVDETGVTVKAPSDTDEEKITKVLKQKGSWISTQISGFEEIEAHIPRLSFLSGEKLPYLGRYYRLKVKKVEIKNPSFRFYQGRFLAEVPVHVDERSYREWLYPLYQEWMKTHGASFAKERMRRYTLMLRREPVDVVVKEQDQRWGSCTPSGKVLLNWRIFMAKPSIIDYVLAHELVHLKHMDHSPAFWETLRMLLPEFEIRKEWLRVHGRSLAV
ncbi:M48 family metallopeptidase [Alkalicoccobacillus porphyridii]|uniref:M48 family metallopeptidase n=1 Tax=Alkalicoccobacillus porphyridii TaxID=2597270 RepID=A0A554A1X4_9BACI|nr:SprT family zinc-dependent metalloprotease [Alkalicoccobacillus porphyridii]TSB47693.1 M48 family metallopeptidase [Alkalicoccobacillus porphyridii]